MIRVCIAALAPETGRLSFFRIVFSWLFISVFTLADTISVLRAPAEAMFKGFEDNQQEGLLSLRRRKRGLL